MEIIFETAIPGLRLLFLQTLRYSLFLSCPFFEYPIFADPTTPKKRTKELKAPKSRLSSAYCTNVVVAVVDVDVDAIAKAEIDDPRPQSGVFFRSPNEWGVLKMRINV